MHRSAVYSIPSVDEGLSQYISQIRRFPILTHEQETSFAKLWRQKGDREAAYRLVTSHLRLVAKIAMRYRGYGLPIADIVSEGNVGLMHAVKRFDPDRGVRLATYAMWWIKATIKDYVLRSWSMVKTSAGPAQKKLFFKLKQAKSAIAAYQDGDLRPDQVKAISDHLKVPEGDIIDMDRRLRGDIALNARIGEGPDAAELIDSLVDPSESHDAIFAENEELAQRKEALRIAIASLKPRERDIFTQRYLTDDPPNLETLARKYDISRERIRQIEARAFEKVKSAMCSERRAAKFDRQTNGMRDRNGPKYHYAYTSCS
jgi:RNA polymerase sigma-32 factor